MRRTALWAAFISIVAVITALMWAAPYHRSRLGITDVSPASNPPVGTAGREAADEPEESPATLHDLETLTGTVDPHELIGRRVDFHVKVADINNDTSFWVGKKDNRMLVVLGHHGAPSPNDVKPAAQGQMVRVTGTIEGIPNAEARYSWGSNDSQRRALEDQKVYIRAEHVTPEG
jgi:hypothetical protein